MRYCLAFVADTTLLVVLQSILHLGISQLGLLSNQGIYSCQAHPYQIENLHCAPPNFCQFIRTVSSPGFSFLNRTVAAPIRTTTAPTIRISMNVIPDDDSSSSL